MDEEYWYCTKHHTVEGAEGCRAKDRLGPYPTREQASRALEIVAERNEKWERESRWDDEASED
ncbi:hypothetical protein GCM10009737_34080 [Nocardioides lentus]|uniref:SPOR domain-containing protein n=1 Tax=Nocardioides lentus TaxID=338077 RepID=A0ABN2PRQ3_9ACTN